LRGRLKNQVGAAREKRGRSACSAFLVMDAPRVKNTDTARLKGDDAGKPISAIKRHLVVDMQGLPHAIALTTAKVTDRKGALLALAHYKATLKQINSILVDNAYTGRCLRKAYPLSWVSRPQCKSPSTANCTPLRSCLSTRSLSAVSQREKNRRLWKSCERKLDISLQFMHLAFFALLLKRYGSGSKWLIPAFAGSEEF